MKPFDWPVARLAAFFGSAAVLVAAMLAAASALILLSPGTAAAEECVRLVPGPSGETLVNQCNACRNVTVLRSRVGNASPTQRSFIVHPGIPVVVPFKGSGRSRMISESPCEGTPGAPVNIVKPGAQAAAEPELACTKLFRVADRVVMLNGCDFCRKITVARTGTGGGEARMSYDLKGKSSIPLDPLGAAAARIVGEGRCEG
ncbi:MAG: hypothetical protein IT564_06025 [Rhodospirillales bacterium]|nr:hypothetical protein [Rhodospirillales bacterium]